MSLHRPDRAEFDRLAESFAVVPVWREVMADELTPVSAFKRLDPAPDGFLLESVEGGERWARFSFLGGDAFASVKAFGARVVVEGSPPVIPEAGEPPLAYVKRLLGAWNAPRVPGLPSFHGGAVGFIGYDCVRELEKLPSVPPDELGLPDLALILTSTFVVFDNLDQKIFVISNVPHGDTGGFDAAVERCDRVVEALGRSVAGAPGSVMDPPSVEAATDVADDEYESWVRGAREHIYSGDIFQVVPSRRFSTPLKADAFDVYRALRTINPSPYMYFLRFGAGEGHPAFDIVGSSPEPLVRVTGRTIVTRPIAGTRPRGVDDDSDLALEQELLADPKERAEHVMLVDLARNDVGRVSEYGSVKVDELMAIERYSHVMHIVSNVSGTLREGSDSFDALTACFPAGTVSGAPKVRAMQIIDEFERTKRGPYAGAVGYFDFSGDMDTCITIRTIVAVRGRAYVQAGAGIVADSVPESEADETRRKAEALLRAVAVANGLSSDQAS